MQMNGQWMGSYSGSNRGVIVIDIDDKQTHFSGYAHIYDGDSNLPSAFAFINAPKDTDKFSLTLNILPLHPQSGQPSEWNIIKDRYKNVSFPKSAVVEFDVGDEFLTVYWKTDIGTFGYSKLPRSKAKMPSEFTPDEKIQNWDEFKKFVNTLDHRRFIFRGQNGSWRLRTSFHRQGRADLVGFIAHDIQALHRNLSARTKHIFNLNIPDENGAFFNLVQHHGYPTPLLDWTYSPYVASFFAYRKENVDSDKVRIFIFDQEKWKKYPQLNTVSHTLPHFSLLEFIAINNERLIPQQAVSSLSNIDDIESYIRFNETQSDNCYLKVIELPRMERAKVMRELSLMGITAGSLFPGLDGACEELKERYFQLQ